MSNSEYSGLYTYKYTKKSKNKIQNLVRVDLDEGTQDFLKFPYLMINNKKYTNVIINVVPDKNNKNGISGETTVGQYDIELGGVFLVTDGKSVNLKLTLKKDKNDTGTIISSQPSSDKLKLDTLNDYSIKISTINNNTPSTISPSHPPGTHPTNSPGPGPGPRPIISLMGYSTPAPTLSPLNPLIPTGPAIPIIPLGPRPIPDSGDNIQEEDGIMPDWNQIEGQPAWNPIIPNIPHTTLAQVQVAPVPGNPQPQNLTPSQLLSLIEGNQIKGNNNFKNQCPPMHPYAYNSKLQGQGDRCCIGKPMQPSTPNGVYTCDNSGSCGATCANNNVVCAYGDACVNNKSVSSRNMCPIEFPYPLKHTVGVMTDHKWGGEGHFCCKTDPGPNNECLPENMATCPEPQCRKNDMALKDIKFIDSIICSQKISNYGQLTSNNKLITTLNKDGFSINSKHFNYYNKLKYITYSKSPLNKYSSKYSVKSQTTMNDIIILKLQTNFSKSILKNTISYDITINIDKLYQNYVGHMMTSGTRTLYITPTAVDMTTCKSNHKPLYPVSAKSYGRDFEWEWQQMGNQFIGPVFISNNINLSGSLTKKSSTTNKTLEDIIKTNSPYTVYKSSSGNNQGQLYYYDKTKTPIKCDTSENCEQTCSGYEPYDSTSVAKKYFTECPENEGIYCTADYNLENNVRECNGKKKNFAFPLPYCSQDSNSTAFGYSFNNGTECATVPYTQSFSHLNEKSTQALNNISIPCNNPPCCPQTHRNAYTYNDPNSDKTQRLCYNDQGGSKSFSCSPTGDIGEFPSCSNPYIENKIIEPTSNMQPVGTFPHVNSLAECKNKCVGKNDCGVYQYDTTNNNTCTLYPLMTNNTLESNTSNREGSYIGSDYKKNWISDRSYGTKNIIDNIQDDVHNPEECYNRCCSNEKCITMSYNSDEGSCKLYSSINEPVASPNSISLRMDQGCYDYRNKNTLHSNINDITMKMVDTTIDNTKHFENFKNGIDDIKIKHVDHLGLGMDTKDAKTIKSKCTESGTVCTDTIQSTFVVNPTKVFKRSATSCPVDYPYYSNGGTECCKINPQQDSSNRGIRTCTGGDMKTFPNSTKMYTDYLSHGISKYAYNPIDGVVVKGNQQAIGCFTDKQSSKLYKGTPPNLVCPDITAQCVGATLNVGGNNIINKDKSTLGYCTPDDSLYVPKYNKIRNGTKMGTSQSAESQDYCANQCKTDPGCLGWNYNIKSKKCQKLNSIKTLSNDTTNSTVTGLNIPNYSREKQSKCNTSAGQILPKPTDIEFIGNNPDANKQFKTEGVNDVCNLQDVDCKTKNCVYDTGLKTGGFTCVKDPSNKWFAKVNSNTGNWKEGSSCIADKTEHAQHKYFKTPHNQSFSNNSLAWRSAPAMCKKQAGYEDSEFNGTWWQDMTTKYQTYSYRHCHGPWYWRSCGMKTETVPYLSFDGTSTYGCKIDNISTRGEPVSYGPHVLNTDKCVSGTSKTQCYSNALATKARPTSDLDCTSNNPPQGCGPNDLKCQCKRTNITDAKQICGKSSLCTGVTQSGSGFTPGVGIPTKTADTKVRGFSCDRVAWETEPLPNTPDNYCAYKQ